MFPKSIVLSDLKLEKLRQSYQLLQKLPDKSCWQKFILPGLEVFKTFELPEMMKKTESF